MTPSNPSIPAAARLANHAAPALLVLAPFAAYVRYHDYPLGRPEVLLCAALLLAFGLAVSGLIALRPLTLRPSLIALLLAIFVDMQFDAELASLERMSGLFEDRTAWPGPRSVSLAGLYLLFAIATWVLRRHLGTIVGVTFAVIIATTLLLPGPRVPIGERLASGQRLASGERPAADLPPLVHIVLDEHIGIDGVPREVPGGAELRRELSAFYQRYGFTLFPRAFSRYAHTNNSLANMLNGTASDRDGAFIETPGRELVLTENAWFRALEDRGYRIRVYQSDYMDFCRAGEVALASCFVYPSNSISSLAEAEIGAAAKARVVLSTYLMTSSFYEGVRWFYIYRLRPRLARLILLPEWDWERDHVGTLAALPVLDRLAAEVARAPDGTAFFAHLLVPHDPYTFDAECRLKRDVGAWLARHRVSPPAPVQNSAESRARRYALYFGQVRCVHRKLAALFEAMRQQGVFERATVVVQGDHGSRISLVDPAPENAHRLSAGDLVDNFSTLFAVRKPDLAPGVEEGTETGMRSIQSLFAELLLDRPAPDDDRALLLTMRPSTVGAPLTRLEFAWPEE